jgi:UDPglucose 6-dehydrogenase
MKIGFIGVGKLGLPVTISMDMRGHDVLGYDINLSITEETKASDILVTQEFMEDGITSLMEQAKISGVRFTKDLRVVLEHGDIIFCAVQTPHDIRYEGVTRMAEEKCDFDYKYLIDGIKQISAILDEIGQDKIVIIISTVLPGTIRRHIFPIMSKHIKLCYNPYFIAMGTVMYDFFNPEFILLGVHDEHAKEVVKEFYKTITPVTVFETSIENAEMIKVSYNTFITAKICLANNIMLMCDNLPNVSCDEVMRALTMANSRLISPKYLTGGMGDGGGCHPRDNIALAWLSNKLGLKDNYYETMMRCRDYQTEYIANIIGKYKTKYPDLDVVLLGKSFKPNTNLAIGSPATLLRNILREQNVEVTNHFDPYIDEEPIKLERAIYCVSTKHDDFKSYNFPKGSIVIDPHRYLSEGDGVIYVPIGVGK